MECSPYRWEHCRHCLSDSVEKLVPGLNNCHCLSDIVLKVVPHPNYVPSTTDQNIHGVTLIPAAVSLSLKLNPSNPPQVCCLSYALLGPAFIHSPSLLLLLLLLLFQDDFSSQQKTGALLSRRLNAVGAGLQCAAAVADAAEGHAKDLRDLEVTKKRREGGSTQAPVYRHATF